MVRWSESTGENIFVFVNAAGKLPTSALEKDERTHPIETQHFNFSRQTCPLYRLGSSGVSGNFVRHRTLEAILVKKIPFKLTLIGFKIQGHWAVLL